jgi:Protein of unknown function (DUF4232)
MNAPRRISFVILPAAVFGLALASCGSASTTGNGSPTTTTKKPAVTSTAPSTAPSTATPTTAVPPTSTAQPAPASPAACSTTSLHVSLQSSSTSEAIVLVNAGSVPCTLQGFPGVSFLDYHGNPVGIPADRTSSSSTPAPVTLSPGASATSTVALAMSSSCAPTDAYSVLVYPPGSTSSVSLPTAGTMPVCTIGPTASVGPVTG